MHWKYRVINHSLMEDKMNRIVRNRIRCNLCGDEIESNYTHELVWCKCKNCYVDGGKSYLRRGFKNSPDDYTELSETVPDYSEDH